MTDAASNHNGSVMPLEQKKNRVVSLPTGTKDELVR